MVLCCVYECSIFSHQQLKSKQCLWREKQNETEKNRVARITNLHIRSSHYLQCNPIQIEASEAIPSLISIV
jgi:hypothetical protein